MEKALDEKKSSTTPGKDEKPQTVSQLSQTSQKKL
jgi:hypothetical protein